ncbi:Mu transposase C-terminal domain-containing protein [Inhella sp.]|uniref:Mu transposase C-terminal domain-containing protein n=1 Tax=Inhella sp. TaxID=1921806 RepID=UPI0035B172E5
MAEEVKLMISGAAARTGRGVHVVLERQRYSSAVFAGRTDLIGSVVTVKVDPSTPTSIRIFDGSGNDLGWL